MGPTATNIHIERTLVLRGDSKRTETDRRMKGKTTRRTLHAYVSGTCRRVEARLESARSKSYCALRLVGLWQHAT